MNSARITVVSPCFNDGATITETIDSIDEREPIEVIIVDDGSTDQHTVSTLAGLDTHSNITVIRHERNCGVVAGINTGLNAATTPFAFIVGADDLIAPNALSSLADALESDPAAAVAWGHYDLFGARTGYRRTPAWDPWRVTYNNYWTGVAMTRRESILALGGFNDRSLYEDWDMWMMVAKSGLKGVVIDRTMFRYRFHEVSNRRCDSAKSNFSREYKAMRSAHRELFEARTALCKRSSLSQIQRVRERLMLHMKLILPPQALRRVHRAAAWLENRRRPKT